mmetsp:Transcript_15866/g.33535  ORF Transcript_15866/g.33535 Transcript_15866/m.33535 type:complete len:88 (+) Transcript_15866:46-309(+)
MVKKYGGTISSSIFEDDYPHNTCVAFSDLTQMVLPHSQRSGPSMDEAHKGFGPFRRLRRSSSAESFIAALFPFPSSPLLSTWLQFLP